MISLGIVVQRYGAEVVGGAETLARDVAERLAGQGLAVTVYTTCARDYVTWRNEYEPGESRLNGVVVRRFPVTRERDIAAFNRLSDAFFAVPPGGDRDEEAWIAEQGPLCPGLVQALADAEPGTDLYLFFTYLYYPTVAGLRALSKPAILFPTAHDELPIRMKLMDGVFRKPRALFFLTQAEMDLVKRLFDPPGALRLVRTGLDLPGRADAGSFRRRHGLRLPYLIYAGRIERGKGLEPVFDHFRALRREREVDLVLIGKKLMDLPDIPGLRYLGFVPEADKYAAFQGAVLSLQPSPLESLSITTLESFAMGTPVLVNRDCPALVEHVRASGGGLTYGGEEEFLAGFRAVAGHPLRRRLMGRRGRRYVQKYYSWDAVIKEIQAGIGEVLRNQ